MTGKRKLATAIVFGLASAGLAAYVNILLQSRTYTILSHGFRMFGTHLVLFLAFWVAFYAFLRLTARMIAGIEAKALGADLEDRLWQNTLAAVPFLFLLLTPLLFTNYLTRDDLRIRLVLLGVFVGLAVLSLKLFELVPLFKKRPPFIEKWQRRIRDLSLRKKLALLFVAAFAVYNLGTFALVSQGVTFSGDEPYYLLTTHSLLYDKDINLANNYADQDYFHFYSKENSPQRKLGIYGRYGKKGEDYIYPISLPGISVLMLPWYKVSQLLKGPWLTFVLKGSLSIWAVLLGLQLFLLARDLWRREDLAFTLWLFYSFSAPVLFYAVHLYPEIPIALFSITIYRKVTSAKPPSNGLLLFLGLLLGSFLWFGLKYNLIFWPLLLVSLYHLWKRHKIRARILLFLLFPLLGTVLFYYFVFSLYGTISPFAVYAGITSPEQNQALKDTLLSIPLQARTDTFFDYFLDQRDGLLLYSPLYFFMFLGLVEIFRKSKRDLLILLFIALPFLLNYAFFTHRQGYCPQARVLAPLSWIGALLIGYFLAFNRRKIFTTLFWAAGLTTLAITVLLIFHPSFLYQPTTHEVTQRPGEFFVFLSNMRFFLPSFLPSFIKVDNLHYIPNYVWIALVIFFIIGYAWIRTGKRREAHSEGTTPSNTQGEPSSGFRLGLTAVLLGIAFRLWVYDPRCVLYPTQTFTYSTQRQLGLYLFPLGKDVVAKNEGELYLHDDRAYKVIFGSKERLEQLKLVFGSTQGEHDVDIRLFDLPVFEGRTTREKKDLILKAPASFPFRNLYVYEIDFRFKKRSTENLKIDPYLLQILPPR
ncbi:MAG: hypothetical protein Q8O91_11735 [Candidatus Aminicenantes bacterium]|nr:hypothetical protein [Candidatus Aminicenantes bacterium]